MPKLADYFVVVGFDHEKQKEGVSNGKILQRFPEKDWLDSPFIDAIEMFCQPQKWRLSSKRQQPSFYMFVLTDIDAKRHYCACLSFNEPIAIKPTTNGTDSDKDIEDKSTASDGTSSATCSKSNNTQHHSIMYAPKCLVLVSRINCKDVLKNCLTIIYTVYIENMELSLETIIGNILACVDIPPPGGPQIRFSIGAGDRQTLQIPLNATIPSTQCCVYNLFEQLGINSVMSLLCAIMTEHKILFHSRSYSQLNDACHALTSLMYPFVYNHIYIPLLPLPLIQVLSTPTPFLMAIHSSLKNEVTDLLDVIIVDLDGGSLSVPDCLRVPRLDESLHSALITQLCHVIRPSLIQADDAFPSSHYKPSPPHLVDKEIRAIFVRTFAQILQGYRSCLTITRIHPKPFITFHKASFLGQRNLVDNDFVVRLLDCMFFNAFVQERGIPYRQCDLFDELYASMQNMLKDELKNGDLVIQHIKELAQQLYVNENPNCQPLSPKIPQPTEGAFTRIHIPPFPTINGKEIQRIIETEAIIKEMSLKNRRLSIITNNLRIVPNGTPISAISDIYGANALITNSVQRLEAVRNCVNWIFENNISDARKIFPAVLRALKNKNSRLTLTQEMAIHVSGNKVVLDHQQFDLITRLMNGALQNETHLDVNGVAVEIMPLAMAFCRKLCRNVIQFAYTCIQDHAVWTSLQFWEQAFYADVERDIKSLYSSFPSKHECMTNANRNSNVNISPSALEIAAEQMARLSLHFTPQQMAEFVANENSTIFAQAIHYVNRMVAMRVSLDCSSHKSAKAANDSDTNSVSSLTISNLFDGNGSNGSNESGFEDDNRHNVNGANLTEIGENVIKFVSRFVDKVCTDTGIKEDYIKQLHQMIPGVVAMQIETIEEVWLESKRSFNLPHISRSKIATQKLLTGKKMLMQTMRAYIASEGKNDAYLVSESKTQKVNGVSAENQIIPNEGSMFVTNYRIAYKGETYEGYLFKKGALLKGWKQRWFVLDSNKHQLFYYSSREDTECKGFIDLREVLAVTLPLNNHGSTSFDLKLARRTYNFMAISSQTAQEWVERIQVCLR